MKRIIYSSSLFALLLFGIQIKADADVKLTSIAVPAATVAQGAQNNIVYIVKMDVTTQNVSLNNVRVIFSGTHDANDLTSMFVYFNPTAPTLTGASSFNGLNATFAAPHTYDVFGNMTIAAGTGGYFIVVANLDAKATDTHTVHVDGAANPVIFSFTTAQNITNNQTDAAGILTIQAANVTVSSIPVPAATVAQGTQNNIVYIVKIDVTTQDVPLNNVRVIFSGTHDANDLTSMFVYFNPTAPTLAGASSFNGLNATFAAPHTYDVFGNMTIAAGTGGYFIVVANLDNKATDGHTVYVDGAANPVVFSFNSAPNVTSNQTNAAGVLTIQAANVILSTIAVPAAAIKPGSTNDIIYIVKQEVTKQPVTIDNVRVTLTGTYDANDLNTIFVYFNPTDPTLAGATTFNGLNATFASPHTYDVFGSQIMAAGTSGYFIVTVNTSNNATIGHTVKVNGATNPIIFSFPTGPNITNNQTDLGGLQILPVNLISFTAQTVNKTVSLNWTTSSETNNAFFEIERSVDGNTFQTLGRINCNGTSTLTHNYNFTDKEPITGNNYYRLKQMDIDNQFQYSKIIKASFNDMGISFKVYPNPVANTLIINSDEEVIGKKPIARLFDSQGKLLKTFSILDVSQSLNTSLLPSGVYTITIDLKNENQYIKFVKE